MQWLAMPAYQDTLQRHGVQTTLLYPTNSIAQFQVYSAGTCCCFLIGAQAQMLSQPALQLSLNDLLSQSIVSHDASYWLTADSSAEAILSSQPAWLMGTVVTEHPALVHLCSVSKFPQMRISGASVASFLKPVDVSPMALGQAVEC